MNMTANSGTSGLILLFYIIIETLPEARQLGREICISESYLFELCASNPVCLDLTWDNVRISGSISSTGTAMCRMGALIVRNDVTSAQIESAIKTFEAAKAALNSNSVGALRRVIRWRALAERETDKIDRFVKFWIALETLINRDEQESGISIRTEEALLNLYRKENPGKNYKIADGKEITNIKNMRLKIFHQGMYASAQLEELLTQLEYILDDLVWDILGFEHKGKARRYLEEIT